MEKSVITRKINVLLLAIPVVLLFQQVVAGLRDPLEQIFQANTEMAVNIALFSLSAATLIPLAGFVESAVEELAELLGPFIGGLLHTTFGNVAELTIALSVLLSVSTANGSEIVQGSIAGVVIRNSLLFLGISTLLGAWRNGHMRFSAENASQYSTVHALAIVGLCLPTIANLVFGQKGEGEVMVLGRLPVSVLLGAVLFVSYVAYIIFAVFRFREGYNLVEEGKRKREIRRLLRRIQSGQNQARRGFLSWTQPDTSALFSQERQTAELRLLQQMGESAQLTSERSAKSQRAYPRAAMLEHRRQRREESGETKFLAEHKVWRGIIALLVLGIATAGVAAMSEHFAESVDELVSLNATLRGHEFFLGLILIPVLVGLVEFYGSIDAAQKNRIEITMAVTAGATIQMVLLVVPILVLVGHFTGHPLPLVFPRLDVLIFLASTFLFMLLSRDGEATWLEGVQLCTLWLLLAVTAAYLPQQ